MAVVQGAMLDWAKQYFTSNSNFGGGEKESLRNHEWVRKGKDFTKLLKFKVLPSNSIDQGYLGHVIAKHWKVGPNADKNIVCVEQSSAFAGQHLVCPICQLKRDLMAQGFTKEELQVAGKFGPVDILDPQLQTVLKVIMMESDGLEHPTWDQNHISLLTLAGTQTMKWLAEKALDRESPDFTDLVNGNIIKFSRETEQAKWERTILDSSFKWNCTPEQIEKIKADNEALAFKDLIPLPSDAEFAEMAQVCDAWKEKFIEARKTQQNSMSSVESAVGDSMPF